MITAVKLFGLLLAGSCAILISNAQQAQVVPASNDLRNGVDTSRPAPQPGQRGLMPVVDVNQENNQSKVDVHVPIFFDMTNLNNPDKSKLDLSVMHGLVTVKKDKERDQDGRMNGPVKVTVFGIPVYVSKGNSPSLDSPISRDSMVQPNQRRVDDSIALRDELGLRAEELSRKVADQVQTANNKIVSTLSNFMGRMSSMLRQNFDSKSNPPIRDTDLRQTPVKVDNVPMSVRENEIEHRPDANQVAHTVQLDRQIPAKDVNPKSLDAGQVVPSDQLKPATNQRQSSNGTFTYV